MAMCLLAPLRYAHIRILKIASSNSHSSIRSAKSPRCGNHTWQSDAWRRQNCLSRQETPPAHSNVASTVSHIKFLVSRGRERRPTGGIARTKSPENSDIRDLPTRMFCLITLSDTQNAPKPPWPGTRTVHLIRHRKSRVPPMGRQKPPCSLNRLETPHQAAYLMKGVY